MLLAVIGGTMSILGVGWLILACIGGARHERRWQKALSDLRAPEARIRVFGEWNNVGECDGE